MKALPPLLFFALFFCGCMQQQGTGNLALFEKGVVAYAVDGDTLAMQNGNRVRLIGIDTPEKGEPCWQEAKDRLRELVEGKKVLLFKDVSETDKYGRLVRYVYADGNFVNLVVVQEGFASAFRFEPDTSLADVFALAELNAKASNAGCLWKSTGGN